MAIHKSHLLALGFLLSATFSASAQTIRPIRGEYVKVAEVRESVQLDKVKRKPTKSDAVEQEAPEEYVERTYYRFYFRTESGETLVFPDIGVPPLRHNAFQVGSCHIVRRFERDEGILSVVPIKCFISNLP